MSTTLSKLKFDSMVVQILFLAFKIDFIKSPFLPGWLPKWAEAFLGIGG